MRPLPVASTAAECESSIIVSTPHSQPPTIGIDADQDGLLALEDLIVSADTDAGKILATVMDASLVHGGVDNVGDGTQGHRTVENVAEELPGAAKRTMADEGQSEHYLTEKGLGDGEGEEDLLAIVWLGREGLLEGLLRLVRLLVNELAADVVGDGELADRLCAGEGSNGELLALVRREDLGGRGGGRGGDGVGWSVR